MKFQDKVALTDALDPEVRSRVTKLHPMDGSDALKKSPRPSLSLPATTPRSSQEQACWSMAATPQSDRKPSGDDRRQPGTYHAR